jgi:translation elongation factor EF-4
MNISQTKLNFKTKSSTEKVISTGDGYLISGIKEAKEVKVGDTVTDAKHQRPIWLKVLKMLNQWYLLGYILLIPKIMKT